MNLQSNTVEKSNKISINKLMPFNSFNNKNPIRSLRINFIHHRIFSLTNVRSCTNGVKKHREKKEKEKIRSKPIEGIPRKA